MGGGRFGLGMGGGDGLFYFLERESDGFSGYAMCFRHDADLDFACLKKYQTIGAQHCEQADGIAGGLGNLQQGADVTVRNVYAVELDGVFAVGFGDLFASFYVAVAVAVFAGV